MHPALERLDEFVMLRSEFVAERLDRGRALDYFTRRLMPSAIAF